MAKKDRPRTQRRVEERAARGLVRDRERLFADGPGGAPDRPIRLDGAVLVEPRATAMPCPQCEGELRLLEHAAVVVDGARLRRVDVRCQRCGAPRSLWFTLEPPPLN